MNLFFVSPAVIRNSLLDLQRRELAYFHSKFLQSQEYDTFCFADSGYGLGIFKKEELFNAGFVRLVFLYKLLKKVINRSNAVAGFSSCLDSKNSIVKAKQALCSSFYYALAYDCGSRVNP